MLESLFISNCHLLTALPEQIGKLMALTRLSICEGYILTALPEQIGNLSALQYLSLDRCSLLTALPEQLFILTELAHLEVRHCPLITVLPEQLGQLTELDYLILDQPLLPYSVGALRCSFQGPDDLAGLFKELRAQWRSKFWSTKLNLYCSNRVQKTVWTTLLCGNQKGFGVPKELWLHIFGFWLPFQIK